MDKLDIVVFILGICVGFIIMVGLVISCGATYEQGQIDAINGDIKIYLKIMPDKSSKWVVKENK